MNEGGFSFVVPTEFVELPSEGRYYPEGHPLCGETSLEIKQMTAKEEDMLTSRTLLKKGVALDRVLASVITNKSIDPDSLLIGDRNAIIVATRVSGYGNIYSTNVNCPSCGTAQEYSFDLNDADIYAGVDTELDITDNNDGTFNVVLPRTGITATFRLLNGYDEKKISSGAELDKKQKVERNVTRQLSSMLVAANGDSSAQAINYLVENLPSVDSRHLRMAYRQTAPNVDLTQHFECSACGHEQDMEVPLSADFFLA
jgi:transcription elongation factor Elf1